MTDFITQAVAVKDHGPVVVSAEATACPHLVITPTVTRDKDGTVRLLGGLRLTHTGSGYAVTGGDENGERLQDLARRLAHLNWDFTEPGDVDQRGAQIIREWHMSTVDTEREVRFPGDDDDLVAARQQDPAGTFLREQLDWWMKHQKALHDKDSELPSIDDNPRAYCCRNRRQLLRIRRHLPVRCPARTRPSSGGRSRNLAQRPVRVRRRPR